MSCKPPQDLIETLKFDLDLLESGTSVCSVRTPQNQDVVPQPSLSCLVSFCDPTLICPSNECVFLSFVPPEFHSESTPCHYIPLTEAGEGVDQLEGWCTQPELEEYVKLWLRKTIHRLETERADQPRRQDLMKNPLDAVAGTAPKIQGNDRQRGSGGEVQR